MSAWSKTPHHLSPRRSPFFLLRRRALAPVHLRSDLQGRVDDWVDVVLLAREWVLRSRARSSSGVSLNCWSAPLRISPLACFFQIPPKHPELSLVPLHRPEEQGQLALLRVQVLGWSPPKAGGTLSGGRCHQIISSSSASWCHAFCDWTHFSLMSPT